MSPIFGMPPYDFDKYDESGEYDQKIEDSDSTSLTHVTFWYMMVLVVMLLLWMLLFFCLRIISLRQKTRNPQQRRMYVGTRGRPSLGQTEPPIFVSPSNLPPPPKYECMAPPSYEEVVGVHYPNYPAQPITQPITTALAQSASNNTQNNENRNNNVPETVITVSTDATRTEVPVARS